MPPPQPQPPCLAHLACRVAAQDDVEAFFKEHECEGAARTVQQSAEAIRTAAATNAREGAALVAWLKEQAAA